MPTIVGGQLRTTKKTGAVIGRAVPWIGYAEMVVTLYKIAQETRERYNLITRPYDRIQWTVF